MIIDDVTQNWKWLFKNAFDWPTILKNYYPNYPTEDGFENEDDVIEFMQEILESIGDWTNGPLMEMAARLDKEGAGEVRDGRTYLSEPLQNFIKECKQFEVFGLPLPKEYGGMGAPISLFFIMMGVMSRACISSSTLMSFYTSIAEMVHRYCDHETAARVIPQIIAGELSGSMNLTEPGCGSDLSKIKTTAVLQEDGSYLLNGSKCFITNGGGGLAFVLARVQGDPMDLSGISMFFMEQDITDANGEKILNFKVTKNEEKMGMHGSFTTEVVYENAKAHLVGEQGNGFKYMLHLMNEARIGVGLQAVGGIEGVLGHARAYSQERQAFGKPIAELPLLKRLLTDYETERDALAALLADTLSHFDIFLTLDNKNIQTGDLTEEEEKTKAQASLWTRKRTPLVKYYACEAYTEISQRCIQVLGGYGFMQEYPVERYHRDSFGPLLYEGTSQIQALMAMKDLFKFMMKDPKQFFKGVLVGHPTNRLFSDMGTYENKFRAAQYRFKKKLLKLILGTLNIKSPAALTNPKKLLNEEAIDQLMIHAETLCQGLCYLETLRVLASHADKDSTRAGLFDRYMVLVGPRFEGIYQDWKLRR